MDLRTLYVCIAYEYSCLQWGIILIHFMYVLALNLRIPIVFVVLGTQEPFYYLVAGLFERDHLHPMPPTD